MIYRIWQENALEAKYGLCERKEDKIIYFILSLLDYSSILVYNNIRMRNVILFFTLRRHHAGQVRIIPEISKHGG